MSNGALKRNTIYALFWKFSERFGVSFIQFILQIILARLLSPSDYGMLSIMIIFTNLANVFIQNGFNTALIQKKDTSDNDYSSVFWLTFVFSLLIYAFLFLSAPIIANFYSMPNIIFPFRVLALMIIPGALNSIQIAIVSKKMDFKKIFTSNFLSIIVSGIIGVSLAFLGMGVWALVFQSLANVVVSTLAMWFTVKWRPQYTMDFHRVKELFSFGWKLLVSSLLETLYQDLSSLVIGRKYNSSTLGFYNRGKQFPQFITTAVNGTVQSVMLPAMSSIQDDKQRVKQIMRRSITLSSYLMFPIMAGLAIVSEPLVKILLTDKWVSCVPYIQIFCFVFAFYPVHTCNLQTINAIGRSDIFLKLEVIKKIIGIAALSISVFCFDSPMIIALSSALTTVISCFVNAFPNKKLINYSYLEQIKDILPNFVISILMIIPLYFLKEIISNSLVLLLAQLVMGIVLYILISILTKNKSFYYVFDTAMDIIKKKTND